MSKSHGRFRRRPASNLPYPVDVEPARNLVLEIAWLLAMLRLSRVKAKMQNRCHREDNREQSLSVISQSRVPNLPTRRRDRPASFSMTERPDMSEGADVVGELEESQESEQRVM